MYPLPAVLLGIDEGILPAVRRELGNVEADVTSEFVSVFAAIDCLRHYRKQPRLLIAQIGPDCQADGIRRLATNLSGWPILALVPVDGRTDFLPINRAGAMQVVPLPLDPDDLQRALNVIGSQSGTELLDRRVFAVTGAAGGSGTTTIAINLGYEIAEQLRRSTILAEFTLHMGALASLFDVEPRVTLPHLIREIHRVDDLLVERTLVSITDRLRILAGPDGLTSMPSVVPGDLIKIVDCLKTLAEVTVLDMPGNFDELELEVFKTCDHVIVIGSQTVPSIKSLRRLCESLPEERVVHSLSIVLNRYNPAMKGFTCHEIKQLLGIARVFPIANDFHAVNLSVNKGRPLREVAPRSSILHDLNELIREVMSIEPACPKANGNGLFRRAFHALTR
jgi:pilus assembly protein CpaE